MRHFHIFTLVFFFFEATPAQAQCTGGEPMVIINEVGNFGRNAEYVELLVVGLTGNPYAKVDMSDWILDDNNYAGVQHGNEQGHLRFGPCFSAMSPGTLIVIYNGDEPPPGLSGGGANVLVISASDQCLYAFENAPTHGSSSYLGGMSASPNWMDFVPLRNDGDGIQILDAAAKPKHAVSWGDCVFGNPALTMPMQGSSAQNQAFMLMSDKWQSASQYSSSPSGSPGAPNSMLNAQFIQKLLDGSANTALSIDCSEKKGASGPNSADGEAEFDITGGFPDYKVEISGPSPNILLRHEDGKFSKGQLLPGAYQVVLTDGKNCTATCGFEITSEEKIQKIICEGQCTDIGEDFGPEFCYTWYPQSEFANPNQPLQTVCPTRNTSYFLRITNDDGQLVKEIEYKFIVKKVFVEIKKSVPDVICANKPVTLDAGPGYDTYNWIGGGTGGSAQTFVAYDPGTYSVTVTKDSCTSTASITVQQVTVPLLNIDPYSTAFICKNYVTLSANGAGYQHFEWNRGGVTLGLEKTYNAYVEGVYTLIASTPEGCTSTQSVEVKRKVQNVAITPNPAVLCPNGTVNLTAPAGFASYKWVAGGEVLGTGQTLVANRAIAYQLTVTASDGCDGTAETTVTNSNVFSAVITPNQAKICQRLPGAPPPNGNESTVCTEQITLGISPGGFATYIWSTGSNSPNISVGSIGSYTVTITDQHGCSIAVRKTVEPCLEGLSPNLKDGETRYLCSPGAVVNLDAGNGFDSYTWSTGQTSQAIQVSQGGTYTVRVVKGDCWAESAINVIQLAAPGDLDLEIHKPAVIDPAEPIVADEDAVGAMTFVNVDNDDRDNLYDINDNQVNAGPAPHKDNDLVKLKLKSRIPVNGAALSRVKLEASAMANHIRFYRSADKSAGEYMPNTEIELTQIQGGFRYEFIWVEGIVQHTAQRQTRIRLYCDPNCPNSDDEVALTIVGIQSLKWEGINNNSENDDNTLTPETNPTAAPIPGAVKVFPDGRTAAEAPRNLVNLVVTLSVAPVEPLIVYVKSFDVDDPTGNGAGADPNYVMFLDPNDALAANAAGGDYAGTPPGTMTYTPHEDNRPANDKAGVFAGQNPVTKIASINFAVGITEMKHQFTVSMQPGDNYRAVAFMQSSFLEHLENLDRRDVLDVVDNTTLTPVAATYVSNLLTVWRFLHVENRSMGDDYDGINSLNAVTFYGWAKNPNIPAGLLALSLPKNPIDDLRYYFAPKLSGGGLEIILDNSHNLDDPPPCAMEGRFQNGVAKLYKKDLKILGNSKSLIAVESPNGDSADLAGYPCAIKTKGNPQLLTNMSIVDFDLFKNPNGKDVLRVRVSIVNGDPLSSYFNGNQIIPCWFYFKLSTLVNVLDIDIKNNDIFIQSFQFSVNRITDDDKEPGALLPHKQNLTVCNKAYNEVFIKVIDDNVERPNYRFDQYLGDQIPPLNTSATIENDDVMKLQSMQELGESTHFWVAHVVSGWQDSPLNDNDPDAAGGQDKCPNYRGLYLGKTFDRSKKFSNQFLSNKDIADGGKISIIYRALFSEDSAYNEDHTVAHEIGHQFGLGHGSKEDGLNKIDECSSNPQCNKDMGLMWAGTANTSTFLIPRYQNLIRSRTKSPGN